jgi:cytoskeletal protein CcmA (bactofilin family)
MALFSGKAGGKDGRDEREPASRDSRGSRSAPVPAPAAIPPSPLRTAPESPAPPSRETRRGSDPIEEGNMANVGKSITIKGDLSGNEDVLVEGKVEGKVDLPQNQLTVGANGICEATVHAKTVIIVGRVAGNVSAVERVEIQATGVVDGDVKAPRLVVAEGAVLNGSISMSKKEGAVAAASPRSSASAAKATAASGGLSSATP